MNRVQESGGLGVAPPLPRRLSIERAVTIACTALVLLAIAYAPGLHLRRAYAAVFRAQANVLFGVNSSRHVLKFLPQSAPERDVDVLLAISSRGEPRTLTIGMKSLFGFIPTALFLALVLATLREHTSSVRVLLFGGVAIELYVLAGTGLASLRAWSVHACECSWQHMDLLVCPGWRNALETLDLVLTRSPSLNILLAVLAWFLAGRRHARSTQVDQPPGGRAQLGTR